MAGYGKFGGFVVVASGASTSSSLDLGGTCWTNILVRVGTMSTATNIGVQNSLDGGSTWYNVFQKTIQTTATVGTPQLFISQIVGANGGVTCLPVEGLCNIRFLCTAVVSGGVSFHVLCS